MLSKTNCNFDEEVLSALRVFTKEKNQQLHKKIPVVLTWRDWKTLELWSAGLALACQDEGTLYEFKVTTAARDSLCAASFETLGNKIFENTSMLSSDSICIDLAWDDFVLITQATDRSLRLFSRVGAHVGISLSLCFPRLGYLNDLTLIQATPLVLEMDGFRTSRVSVAYEGAELIMVRGKETRKFSEMIANLRDACDVGLA